MTSTTTITQSSNPVRTEIATLWRLSWPMLVGQLATVGMGVVDVAMTGHVSAAELAAVSLGTSVWSIILVTVMGVMMAVNSVVAHEMGAGRFDRISHSVRESLWMGLLVGIAGCVAANLCALLFDHIGLEQAVADRAKTFLHIISLGMPAFGCYRALYGYTTSINQTKPIMVIAILGLLYNVVLNWGLIFGHFGLPRMGALGCAVSTASGVWLMLAAMIGWIRFSPAYRATYPFGYFEGPNWREIGSMLRLGLPIGVTHFAEVSAFGIVSLLVARFGVVQVSAHQIALNFTSLVFMVPMSFGIGTLTRVGQAMGEGNAQRARFVAWTGTGLCVFFGLLSAIFIALFRWQIAAMYTSDAVVQATCALLLLFAAIFQLSDSTQVAAASAIRGYKVTRSPMVIQMIAFWGVALPVGWILGLAPAWFPWSPAEPMKATGFWIGLVLGLTVAAVLLAWSLNNLSKLRVREARSAS
jgi:MATE family multidrug resistance protein